MDVRLIGSRIKELRQERGITQSELADALIVSYQAVSNWERGVVVPDLDNLIRVAEYFDVLVDVFLRNDDGEVYLGIDGGGEKTEFVLVSSNGTVLKRIVKRGCNPNDIGFTAFKELILEGVKEICSEYPSVKMVFGGIAGVSPGNYIDRLLREFKKYFPQIRVEINSHAFNFLAMDNDVDIFVNSGTGSVVLVRNGESYKRLGGLGYLLDSAGSAYDIGRDALRQALIEEEKMEKSSKMSMLLKKSMNIENVWDHINSIYNGGMSYIADLAVVVFRAYEEGDENAIRIIDENARALADHLNDAVSMYGAKPVAIVSGGLFEHYRDIMFSHIAKYSNVKLKTIDLPLVYGACRRACAIAEGRVPEGFDDNFNKSYGEGKL